MRVNFAEAFVLVYQSFCYLMFAVLLICVSKHFYDKYKASKTK